MTAVREVEAIVNSCPLTYMSSDDVDELLTPSHLLDGWRILSLPDNLSYMRDTGEDDFEMDSNHLNRQGILPMSSISSWGNHIVQIKERAPVAVGDIVLVHDEHQPQEFWKLARVERNIVGKDGQVRGDVLRLSARNGQATIPRRPLQLLYPLKINCHIEGAHSATDVDACNEEPRRITESGRYHT